MNIYIGNLPRDISEKEITELFAPYGEVSNIKLIKDRDTDQFKGFGFLEMSQNSGLNAIKELNDKDLRGRAIVVNEAKPRTENNRNFNSRRY